MPTKEPEEVKELTQDEKIVDAYQSSHRSIQDIARIFNVSVDHVLNLIGAGDLATVQIQGDLIDESELGPGAQFNHGKTEHIIFTTN